MAKRHTEWKKSGPNERIRAEYGLVKLGEQEPYVSVTATVEEKRRGKWVEYGGGAMHEEIVKHFPELEELVTWHLVSPSEPMHYLANGQYWWEKILGTSKWDAKSYDPDPVEAFKSTILYGVLPTDEEELVLPDPPGKGGTPTERPMLCDPSPPFCQPAPDDIRPWLRDRLSRLQQGFQDVVEKYDLTVTRGNPSEPSSSAPPSTRKLKSKLLRS